MRLIFEHLSQHSNVFHKNRTLATLERFLHLAIISLSWIEQRETAARNSVKFLASFVECFRVRKKKGFRHDRLLNY